MGQEAGKPFVLGHKLRLFGTVCVCIYFVNRSLFRPILRAVGSYRGCVSRGQDRTWSDLGWQGGGLGVCVGGGALGVEVGEEGA